MRTTPTSRQFVRAAAGAALPLAARPDTHPDTRPSPSLGPVASPPEREEALALIARLRAQIARREEAGFKIERSPENRGREPRLRVPWQLGLDGVDANLPEAGLARAGLHDVSPAAYGDFPAASGFALALAICRLADIRERRPVLWCRLETEIREYGRSYGHGIAGLGLTRQRFLTITLRRPTALLWTLEEALKSGCFSFIWCGGRFVATVPHMPMS